MRNSYRIILRSGEVFTGFTMETIMEEAEYVNPHWQNGATWQKWDYARREWETISA